MSGFNSFLAAMSGQATGENGLPGVTTQGVAANMQRQAQRGGALVAANAALVRGAGNVSELVKEVLEEGETLGVEAWRAQLEDVCVLAMLTRDCRGGKGEKELAFRMLQTLAAHGQERMVCGLLELLPAEFGSWNDVVELALRFGGTQPKQPPTKSGRREARNGRQTPLPQRRRYKPHPVLKKVCLGLLAAQLKEDAAKLDAAEEGANPGLSLAGKWAPREKRAQDARGGVAKELAYALYPVGGEDPVWSAEDKGDAKRKYRHLVARLNARLGTVEVPMSANDWDQVDPSRVPSRALNLYRQALRNLTRNGAVRSEDPARIRLAERLQTAAEETRKNPAGPGALKGKQLFPYEIVRHFMRRHGDDDPVLEAQWAVQEQAMRDLQAENGAVSNGICLCDVSGSMSGVPMENSIALGILLSRALSAPWTGKVLTFESAPRWHELPRANDTTLRECVRSLAAAPWGGSTDFGAALALILDTAMRHNVPQEDMPGTLYIFTDMQFNQAMALGDTRGGIRGFDTVTKRIEQKYRRAGYTMPHLLFWNLRANTQAFAAEADSKNVSLLSGFSPALFKAFMAGPEALQSFREATPYETLRKLLDDKRYNIVRQLVRDVLRASLTEDERQLVREALDTPAAAPAERGAGNVAAEAPAGDEAMEVDATRTDIEAEAAAGAVGPTPPEEEEEEGEEEWEKL